MPDLPTSPALVTGGTGFLGRRIVARLLDQAAVSLCSPVPLRPISRRAACG